MRRYQTRRNRRRGADGSLWISFSDLMSALVLIIILVLFYVMYQYFDMYEVKVAQIEQQQAQIETANADLQTTKEELEAREAQLVTTETELEEKRSLLTTAQTDLVTATETLNVREEELAALQTTLDEKEATLTELQTTLTEKETTLAALQTELDTQSSTLEGLQTTLTEKETTLTDLQAQLVVQQSQLDDQQQLLETQQTQLEQLIGIKPKIIASLSTALRKANITANVDTSTGAITLESDVLFASGQYDLKQEGKDTIDGFLPVYLDVLFSEEYEPYLSQIIIEGHTDSRGTYMTNLNLSQQRALSVAEYVLSDTYTAITPEQRAKLRAFTTANGRSFSDPVLDAQGNEDMDASRRVVFKFQLIDEQMVAQMQSILADSLTPREETETGE